MKQIFSLGMVKGALSGLAGTGVGIGLTLLVRQALGRPWDTGPAFVVGILVGVAAYLAGAGVLSYWRHWAAGRRPREEPPEPSWRRYFNPDTNHKVIAVQYMVTALTFLPFAVFLQLLGRMHVAKLGPPILSLNSYESVISDHGIVMLFIVVLPAISGLVNYVLPLLIGARDMAFPHLNAFSYWLVPPAGLLTVFSLAAGGFDTGWTVYPPLSANFEPLGMDLILLGVYLSGLSSILSAINFLTTIFKMRAPGMSLFRMPVFVWTVIATTGLSLVFTQFVAMAFVMVLLERTMGLGFFNPDAGGSALLYQHLFWFYSHPAVYIFVLPGLGVISELLPVFVRKPLFGYKAVSISGPGIALGGVFVWGHHMFASGMASFLRIPFMITTLLVAVPTGVKVFAWAATMWLGKLRLTTAFLFVVSAIVVFLIGGLTGVPLGIVPVDLYLHDTYFVVGHFHATLFGGFLFPFMAAIYYWFPKVSGRMLGEKSGKTQWLLMTLGGILIIVPMLGLGLEGQRRRVADYPAIPGAEQLHLLTAVGAFLVFAGLVILFYNIVVSIRRGATAGANPWEGRTLEWQVSSPPPEENFITAPQIIGYPYGYGIPGSRHVSMPVAPEPPKEVS